MDLALESKKCNTTLEDMRIGDSESPLFTSYEMTFHHLGLIISMTGASVAIITSLFLIFMHAIHYTKPDEQRQILFMVPIYSIAAFLSYKYYWHAIYFQVLCDCYEAFAIASFFALLCHYIAPDLHQQKDYFRSIEPKKWIWPLNWMKMCCAGTWRTPRSGLTWFNIIWTGVYQYCFIRVAMTIVAVVTQYMGKLCESSNLPQFAHIWVLVIEGLAVTVAMYCLVQFYTQLRHDLAAHRLFRKFLTIKLVIFLSFWQSFMISILTSASFNVVTPNPKIAYPDLKVGVPSLLLCIEMAIFSILHLYAFPYSPYTQRAKTIVYPLSKGIRNDIGPMRGGPFGLRALADAMNPWDLVKSFARAMRWLFVGRKIRENDTSYNTKYPEDQGVSSPVSARTVPKTLPIADEFRRSKFVQSTIPSPREDEGLIAHPQTHSLHPGRYVPARQRYDANGQDLLNPSFGSEYHAMQSPYIQDFQNQIIKEPFVMEANSKEYLAEKRLTRRQSNPSPPHQLWARFSSASKKELG